MEGGCFWLYLCVFVILQLLGVDGTVLKEALTHKKIIAKGEEVCSQLFTVKILINHVDKVNITITIAHTWTWDFSKLVNYCYSWSYALFLTVDKKGEKNPIDSHQMRDKEQNIIEYPFQVDDRCYM